MKKILIGSVLAALIASGAAVVPSFAADEISITIVNPNDNKPVANKAIHVKAKGEKSLVIQTDDSGKATLPATFKGRIVSLRCSKVPLMFNTKQVVDDGITVVLKHQCAR